MALSDDRLTRRGAFRAGATALIAGAVAPDATGQAIVRNPGDLIVTQATHRVETDLLVEGDLVVARGAQVEIGAGATLRVRGDVAASPSRIFVGAGKVDLTASRALAARPEWWGAAADDPAIDCQAALSACLAAHPAMLLGPGDYHLGGTWTVNQPNRRIWGIGRSKDQRGTRLLLTTGGTGTVVQVGPTESPSSINAYLPGIDIRWIELGRTAPGAGDGAIGLAIRHVLNGYFEGVTANEHAVGFSIRGAVRSYLHDCSAFRSLVSGGGGRDSFTGFDLDGLEPAIGTGANASIYLIDCNATVGGAPSLSRAIGARIAGAFSDTFLVRFESSAVATGIRIDGIGAGTGAAFDQIDVHIETPVLDAVVNGLQIAHLGPAAMVEIVSPYIGLAGGGATALSVEQTGGSIHIAGGQCVGRLAAGATGIALTQASGVALEGCALLGFSRPLVAHGLSAAELAVTVVGNGPTAEAAITLEACRHVLVRPRLPVTASRFGTAVAIDAASRGVTVEVAAIDPDAVGGVAQRVTRGGQPLLPVAGSSAVVVAP